MNNFGKKRATLKKTRAIRVKIKIKGKISIGCDE
jgi:hypothetical protein